MGGPDHPDDRAPGGLPSPVSPLLPTSMKYRKRELAWRLLVALPIWVVLYLVETVCWVTGDLLRAIAAGCSYASGKLNQALFR